MGSISTYNVLVTAASPPCQSWSVSGSGLGLLADTGKAMLEFSSFLARVQPAIVLLENVVGLKSHPHFRFLTALWHELGLQLIHLEILHSCHVIATDRRRLLCILKRRDLCIPFDVIQHAAALVMPLPNMPATISSLGCLLPPNFHCTTLDLSIKELMRLSDPALLPGNVGTADETLKARDVRCTQEVRAIMASYRSSISFEYKFLCEKKLLAHIVSTDDNYRLLHPFEIASILGYPAYITGEALKLPVDFDSCYKLLGNSFIPCQSAFAWIKVQLALIPAELYLGFTSGTAAL